MSFGRQHPCQHKLTVNDIKTIRDDWGRDIEIIVIEADDKEADTKGLLTIMNRDCRYLHIPETIISKMVEYGIIGMGERFSYPCKI